MSSMYVQAKISNFIHRKQATVGDDSAALQRNATKTLGIYYETLAFPRLTTKKES